jgi:hypothetical protein
MFDLPVQLLARGTYTVLVAPGNNSGNISVEVHTAGTTEPASAVLDDTNALSANLVGLFVMDAGGVTIVQNFADGSGVLLLMSVAEVRQA